MSGGWVAGGVRARLLAAERRLGPDGAREVARAGSLPAALLVLARTPYRADVELGQSLEDTQRAVATTLLLELRLLAGWLPGDALALLRALAAWYELVNIEDRLAYLGGAPARRPFELGALGSAWPAAAEAQGLEEMRRLLASSGWGDPDGATPAQAGIGLRLAWARRVAAEAPEARAWAAGALALLVARALYVSGIPVEQLEVPAPVLLGSAWQTADTYARFAAVLPRDAAWALEAAPSPAELWRAEARWWTLVEQDAGRLLRSSAPGRRVVVGAVALLAVDAHRTAAALAAAARHGLTGVEEAFDAAA